MWVLVSSGSVWGVEVGGVGQHVDMLFVGGPLREHGPLHVLTSRGWKTMVASGADHDENLPLVKEDLVPPLHLGLPRPFPPEWPSGTGGERATKVERWESDFD